MTINITDDLDREWLRFGLEQDAQLIAALTLQGKSTEADAHIEATNYKNRLTAWKAGR
jgi:hypothetical protein